MQHQGRCTWLGAVLGSLVSTFAPGVAQSQLPTPGAVIGQAEDQVFRPGGRGHALAPAGSPPQGSAQWPSPVLQLANTEHDLLIADLRNNRLYQFGYRNNEWRVVRSMYASIGKAGYGKQVEGDNLTPVGIYQITSWLDGDRLPALYGDGAWPVSYPNALDRFEGRTGYGIWLHGNPQRDEPGLRPPRSSEGCLTLTNTDLNSLKPFVDLGQTRVVFSDEIEWLTPEQRRARQQAAMERLQEWQLAWESLDAEMLGEHYHPQARIGGLDRRGFISQKHAVNQRKEWIALRLDQVTILDYPGDYERLLIEFEQDYRSNNYRSVTTKRQIWQKGQNGWAILLEDTVPGAS